VQEDGNSEGPGKLHAKRKGMLLRHSISSMLRLGALALLLHAGALQARPDPEALGIEVEAGNISQVRQWLDAGMHPDMMADRIGTGLMIAAWFGDIPMMALFVQRGADVNKQNALGERAVMHAAWRGQSEAVAWLVARGARVNSEPMQWSALHYAVFAGHGAVATQLLERGADINARSTNGSSVLMMAVYEGHENLVRQLIAKGADPGIKNDRGDGALEWAFRYQRLSIARLVSTQQQFVAAANRPPADWGAARRSVAAPAAGPAAAAPDPTAQRIEELVQIRGVLASRGMKDAVAKLDQRIAALRAQRPRVADADPAAERIEELMQMRNALAARGMTSSVDKLDRRIAALRAQRARAERDSLPTAVLEISASRAAPEEQGTRLIRETGLPEN
jgi:ankyrin repeat protein/uncharacterized small protein (DUF1192 family)